MSGKYWCIFLIGLFDFSVAEKEIYDRLSGSKVESDKLKEYKSRNISRICTINIEPCKPHEFRRIDGTCNNFNNPSRGSAFAPYLHLLKPHYEKDGSVRKGRNSTEALPSARQIRTAILNDGRVLNNKLNKAVVHFLSLQINDVTSLSGKLDYVNERRYCCSRQGKVDPKCMPILVPDDDPYLGVTEIRCLNFSRAQTFQDIGCDVNRSNPEQINLQTPLFDLSTIYGTDDESLLKIRANQSGLLLMEQRKGKLLPLGDAGNNVCFGNKQNESSCYRFGDSSTGNIDLRSTSMLIWFMKEHNRLAKMLLELNSCWSDEKTFQIARQINIATVNNILLYELYPLILGRKNMLDFGLIQDYLSHVNDYETSLEPSLYAEFVIAMRFFHTLVDGRIQCSHLEDIVTMYKQIQNPTLTSNTLKIKHDYRKYDEHYKRTSDLTMSSTLFRTDLLEQGTNLEEINRGTFYQKISAADDTVDSELSERFFSQFHKANDLFSIDIQRGRDLGLRSYNEYRQFCGLQKAKTFEDFADTIYNDKIDTLRLLYKDIDDVDLLAGIASEFFLPGGLVGPTLFCIAAKQLLNNRLSDRFWFERNDHYFSFTTEQLEEIRKTSIAKIGCDNADGVKYMQRLGFLVPDKGNEMVSCEHLPGIDLTKWIDPECHITTEDEEGKEERLDDYDFPFSFLNFKS